jgi:hypothetical protein
MAFRKSPKHVARRVAATLLASGAGSAVGAGLGRLANQTKDVTEYTRIPNIETGEGLGTLVPHTVQAATTAAEQLHGTSMGAALGLAATAGGILMAHRAVSKAQLNRKK